METRIFKIDPQNPDPELIREAAKILKNKGILAIPTETVYGLGADAYDGSAAKRIYGAKGRPSDNPLIVHISDMDMLEQITRGDLTRAKRLAEKFWPGPLTMVLDKSTLIPPETTGGLDTVAVRMPSRLVARRVIAESGLPIAAPSANISGRPSATCAAHVIEDFNGKIDGIVDDGSSEIGVESTIVDLTVEVPVILRAGYITAKEISDVLGMRVEESFSCSEKEHPKAPGMKYRHYAPKGELILVRGGANTLCDLYNKEVLAGRKAACIVTEETKGSYSDALFYSLGHFKTPEEILKNLYGVLRKLDEEGVEIAFCESFEDRPRGGLIMEKLIKSSGGKIT